MLYNQKTLSFVIRTGGIAFAVYFCMYALRKPFAAAKFSEMAIWGLDYKVVLILAQVAGYTLSKFLGIRIISGMNPLHRMRWLIGAMCTSALALLGFALSPSPWQMLFIFLNGLPLGLIWGLVFSYLEGRRTTEVLASMLSASFIIASGLIKSMSVWMMSVFGLSEYVMPFVMGSLFLMPFLFFAFALHRTPAPDAGDIIARHQRQPMTKADRKAMFSTYRSGILILVGLYMLITAFRDFRDNFSVEIWEELGVYRSPSVFTISEIPVVLLILIIFSLFFLIRNNYRAFQGLNLAILAGLIVVGLSTFLFQKGLISSPMIWTSMTGIGLYLAYFPYNSMLFERLHACYPGKGNAGYLIYLADSFGYIGSVLILLYREFFSNETSFLQFFQDMAYSLSGIGIVAICFTGIYFRRKILSANAPGNATGQAELSIAGVEKK